MTEAENIERLKYPIGKFTWGKTYSKEDIARAVSIIEALPSQLKVILTKIPPTKMTQSYRPDGWNAYQLVHHLADVHVNVYARIKLALTEDNPTIKPFNEKGWILLADALEKNLTSSLDLIGLLTQRILLIYTSLPEGGLGRTFHHPELSRDVSVGECLVQFAFHSSHHLEHIRLLQ